MTHAFSDAEISALAAGYLRYVVALRGDDPDAVSSPETNPDEWAYKTVETMIRKGAAAEAWPVVLELLRQTPDAELGNSAAGPLEALVLRHGEALVEAIEAEAAQDERFRWALGCIWLFASDLKAPIRDRIVRASGGAIKVNPSILSTSFGRAT
ncbi:MAG TPA: hypothetical protein VF761_01950 [Gemmatimonadaceae bacterium]